MKKDIILSGVGGQGILSIATVIGKAALKDGLYMKQAEVHGMSQRGGDVQSNLRISDQPIASDLIPSGKCDLIIALLKAPQRRHDAVLAVARLFEELVRRLYHLLEHLAVLLEYRHQRTVVDARHVLHRRADLADADAEHLVRGLGPDDGRFLGFGGLDLLDVAVAANQQPCAECDEHRHGDPAAPQQEQCHAEGDQESAERRDEPARDDGHHARNAVYGALASPGAVGQRRTHGHHEYHIGRRQRQLVRSADGDQDRCGREVHDGADHVVRCRRTLLCGQRLEPPVDGLLHADGDQKSGSIIL